MASHTTRKDRRKKLTGPRAVDMQCKNHGTCPWCLRNRLHKNKKRELSIKEKEDEI